MGQLLDQAFAFQFFEHLRERTAQRLLQTQRTGELVERDRVVPNLQKTKDIINAEMSGASHAKGPFLGAKIFPPILVIFLKLFVTFFSCRELHKQANTRPISRPPSG